MYKIFLLLILIGNSFACGQGRIIVPAESPLSTLPSINDSLPSIKGYFFHPQFKRCLLADLNANFPIYSSYEECMSENQLTACEDIELGEIVSQSCPIDCFINHHCITECDESISAEMVCPATCHTSCETPPKDLKEESLNCDYLLDMAGEIGAQIKQCLFDYECIENNEKLEILSPACNKFGYNGGLHIQAYMELDSLMDGKGCSLIKITGCPGDKGDLVCKNNFCVWER